MTQTASAAPLSATPRKVTFEEFLDWGDPEKRYEWVDGEIIEMTSPSDQHQDLASFLTALLRIFVEERRLGIIRPEFTMRLPLRPAGREPDILFLSNQNTSRMETNYLDGPADLVVEIVRPESSGRDRGDKYYEYEQAGIREYWMLDRMRRQAEFYQLDAAGTYQRIMPGAVGVYHSAVLSGLWLRVEWLWQDPLPSLMSVLREWGIV
jgi:Uma2 family endonuclease